MQHPDWPRRLRPAYSDADDDVLIGWAGPDTFVFRHAYGHNVIAVMSGNADTIDPHNVFDSSADIVSHANQRGGNVLITLEEGSSLSVENVKLLALNTDMFML